MTSAPTPLLLAGWPATAFWTSPQIAVVSLLLRSGPTSPHHLVARFILPPLTTHKQMDLLRDFTAHSSLPSTPACWGVTGILTFLGSFSPYAPRQNQTSDVPLLAAHFIIKLQFPEDLSHFQVSSELYNATCFSLPSIPKLL